MQQPIFTVHCYRIKKQARYEVYFSINDQLIERIKSLPSQQRTWNTHKRCWEITTKGLYEIIKFYRNSKKIIFDFDDKQSFVEQIKKIDKDEKEKERLLKELNNKKQYWLKLKQDLENNYENYWERIHKPLKKGIKLYPHQVTASIFLNQVRNALISHEMGLGKANPIDSKILTCDGWVRMGDINVGDFVIGSNGKPTKVLGVFPQGEKDIYELKFSDGTTAQSCDEHLWNVNTQTRNFRGNSYQTKTLRKIMDDGLQYKNGNNKNYIPIVKPIEFQEKKLKIDPYILGCLLGDGGITIRNSISFSSIDEQIICEIENKLPKNHKMVLNGKSKKDYYLVADGKNNYINQGLKEYKLKGCNSHTKFIPHDYKFSSIEQRLELLRGILDTDGHSRKDGIVELTLASKILIKEVQFIVQTLGGIGRLKNKLVEYNGEKRKYYRLNIKLPPQFIPFKLQRKINTFVPPTKYLPNRAIKEVNYVGKKDAQCILVDAEDHLYLTDNCVVTHNTLSAIAYVEMNDFQKIFVITPNSLKFNFYYEVEKFTNSKAHIINWKKNKYSIDEAKYVIVNYDFFNPKDSKKMNKKFKELGIEKIDCLIADECHRIKSTKSNTYKNFKRIFKDKIFKDKKVSKVFLSGTPAPNRAYELYTVLNQISPLEFPTKDFYYKYYLGMEYDPDAYGGWSSNPTKENLEELYHNIAPYTHRKKKQEVLKDLPDKIYQKIMLEFTPKELSLYNEIEEGIANEFINEEIQNPLTIMLRLRQYTALLKTKTIIEFVDRLLDEGEKVVIVDYFKESLGELKEHYRDVACLHTGDFSVDDRAMMVKRFQNADDEIKIFLGSIPTTKEGLTLTAANKIFLITLPYSLGEFDQVIDRCILKGELILTKEGYIPIENINVGDFVYTHKGNWKKVRHVTNKIERKKTFYDIKYKGFYKPLRCTEDHKIYVYDIKNMDYIWIEAKNLNIYNHYLVMPKINLDKNIGEFFVKEHITTSKIKKDINKDIELNDVELLYSFGRFVGDGHVNDHQVSICGHINEYDEVLFSIKTIKSKFGLENHTEYRRNNKIEMYISSIELRNNFARWFNCGAKNKVIPDFIFKLDNELIKSFLNGYYSADGYKRKNTQQASTVSKYLSYQLVQLEGLLGNTPTLRYNDSARSWSFEYSINNKIKRKKLIKNNNGDILYPIQEIKYYKPKRDDERVYDLEIEDDHSFIVGLSTVHNCHRIGQKDVVNAYFLIFQDSIDEYVFNAIEGKRAEISKVIDNEDYQSDVFESVISEVMDKIIKKHDRKNLV